MNATHFSKHEKCQEHINPSTMDERSLLNCFSVKTFATEVKQQTKEVQGRGVLLS